MNTLQAKLTDEYANVALITPQTSLAGNQRSPDVCLRSAWRLKSTRRVKLDGLLEASSGNYAGVLGETGGRGKLEAMIVAACVRLRRTDNDDDVSFHTHGNTWTNQAAMTSTPLLLFLNCLNN